MDAPGSTEARIGTSCCLKSSLPRGLAPDRRTVLHRTSPWLTTLRQTFRNPHEGLNSDLLGGNGSADDRACAGHRRQALQEAIRCESGGEALRNRRTDATARLGGRRPGSRRLGALPACWRVGLCAGPLPVLRRAGAAAVRHGVGPGHVVGLVILSLMLLATIAAVLHLIGRRNLDAPRRRTRDGARANQRQTRPCGADVAQRAANPRLLGSAGRGADD